ncbi:DUF1961 family protein [Butyrivibrio sp. FCS014]|uniref:DUF1961 family protein n=1 Tax=Butyrivibrio sp. FCS014 TaxID=1408304 RepID=UPI000467707D|nr:DUF1961 family protein [Butyrivibrio sp. FCS014]
MSKVVYEDPEIRTFAAGEEHEGIFLPGVFPADIKIEWEFKPIKGAGCAAVSFAMKDENAFHMVYFRRGSEEDRAFHVCSLIKDAGNGVVAAGADPLPDLYPEYSGKELSWYRMTILKKGRDVAFWINDLEILSFHDDGMTHGEMLTGGNVVIRQDGDLAAEYRNLKVTWI